MKHLLPAFFVSLRDFFRPSILFSVLLPVFVAFALWAVAVWAGWDLLQQGLLFLMSWMNSSWVSWVLPVLSFLTLLILFPLALLLALLFISLWAMPVITRFVGKKYFPQIEKRPASLTSQVKNATRTSLIFITLWIITLPLWLLPGVQIPLSLILNAFLNYRLLGFEALCEFATEEEIEVLLKEQRGPVFTAGLILALLLFVPFLFIILPHYGGLVFTHLGLKLLENQRLQQKTSASV